MEFSHKWCFRVYSMADPYYALAIRDGNLVLTPFNPSNDNHFWFKDMSTTKNVKDKEGVETFVLVNKATGEAIKHSALDQPVTLVPFKEDIVDLSLLLSEASDTVNNGYKSIRMATDTSLYLDAQCGETKVEDGTKVVMKKRNNKRNQWWRIERYLSVSPRPPTFRVCCLKNPKLFLTIRDGKVFLSRSNENDDIQFQLWYIHASEVKDADNNPGFSLINKATGQALKHSVGSGHTVQLAFYYTSSRDDSVVWSMVRNENDGYGNVRMINNTELYFASGDTAGYSVEQPVTVSKNDSESQLWGFIQYKSSCCCS